MLFQIGEHLLNSGIIDSVNYESRDKQDRVLVLKNMT